MRSFNRSECSSEGNQFFSRCGVDSNSTVEISLSSAHLYGDGETLDDLIGTLTNDVDPNDSFLGALHDELEFCGFLVLFVDHAEIERFEGGFVNFQGVSVLLSSLWFGQTDGSYGRVREDNRRDVFVDELIILVFGRTEETVGEPPSSGDGDGGQKPLASYISDGSDAGNAGILVFVDNDVALGGGFNANVVQTKVFGVCLTTDCPQENIGLDLFALVGVDGQISWLALNLCNLGLSAYFDASVLHPRSKDVLNGRVEGSEDGVSTNKQMGFGSKGVEDAGEFDGDITSADDDDSFRLVLEIKETIRCDTEAGPRNFLFGGDGWVTTDGDANVVGFDGVGFLTRGRDSNLSGGKDCRVTVEKIDTFPIPVILVYTTEFLDITVSLGFEGCPVEFCLFDTFELVSHGLLDLVGKISGMPHQLLWDTSDVDAGTTVVRGCFYNGNLLVVRSGTTGCSRATASTANEDDVVFVSQLNGGHFGGMECS